MGQKTMYEIGVEVIYSGGYVGVDWCPYESFPVGGIAQCIKPSGQLAFSDPNVPSTGCQKQYSWSNFQECGTWKVQAVVNGQVVGYPKTFVIDVTGWGQGLTCGSGNGPCGQPTCYKCNGASCEQDNVNGTYTTCTPNPCVTWFCNTNTLQCASFSETGGWATQQECMNNCSGNGGGNNGNCQGKIICSIPDSYIYIGGIGILGLILYMSMSQPKRRLR